MATIAGHLSIEELDGRYRGASAAVEGRHYQAIWLLARGRTFVEVADVLGFVPRWVEELAQRYNAQGPRGAGGPTTQDGRPATVLTATDLVTYNHERRALARDRRAGRVN